MKRFLIFILCFVLFCVSVVPCFAATNNMQIEQNEDGSFFIIIDEINFTDSDDDLQVPPTVQPDEIPPTTPNDSTVSELGGGMNSLMQILQKIIAALRRMLGLLNNQKEATKTASNTKYIYYYSANSELLWHAQLTGEFAYTSTSAWCTNAAFDFRSLDSNWQLDDYTCKEQNATASVTFSVVQKSLGVKLQTITKTLTLTCDTNGKVT